MKKLQFLPLLLLGGHLGVFGQVELIQSTEPPLPETVHVAEPVPAVGLPDAPVVESFLDGVLAAQLEAHHLAGAALAVVCDGEVLLTKGYGQADLESGRPVDPGQTLFRLGSISKLLIWISVMQLEEEGRLDLNADVNRYLKRVQVPSTFEQPVTMNHLMAHTAGFEDRLLRLFLTDPQALPGLEALLARDLPQRVRPPGAVSAYSNHGAALAALVVQDITGRPWEDYVQERILNPLGLERTSFAQPLPPDLKGALATAYSWNGSDLEGQPFQYISVAPAGAGSSCADDMARFMLALLNDGVQERPFLSPNSIRRMFSPLAANHPQVSPMAHGFILQDVNGHRVVGHSGSTRYFNSRLALLPEYRTGLFVAYNAEEGAVAANELVQTFMDRFFPAVSESERAPLDPGAPARCAEIAGTYRSSRRPYTTIDKGLGVLADFSVEPAGGGNLRSQGGIVGNAIWKEVSPYLFANRRGTQRLVFQVEADSGAVSAFLGNLPIVGFEKIPWYETVDFHWKLLSACLVVLCSSLTLPVLAFFCRGGRREFLARPEPTHPAARALAGAISALFVIYLGAMAYVLRDPWELLNDVPPSVTYLAVLPLIAGMLTLVLLIVAAIAWKGTYWGIWARIHFSCVTLAALGLLWQLNYWNLLGWRFG